MLDDNEKLQKEIISWKKKYYAALEQVEEQEKQTKAVESQLRKNLSQLSLSIDGIDDKMDALLEKLRADIRSNRKVRYLAQTIEKIDEAGAKFVKQRQQQAKQATVPDTLYTLLEQLSWPKGLQRQKRALLKHLRSKEAEQQLETTLDGIAQLLNQALEAEEVQAASPPSQGLFSKLFSKKESEPEKETKPEIVEVPEAPAEQPVEKSTESPSPELSPIEEDRLVLEDFIRLLQVPSSLSERLQALKEQLKKSKDKSDISSVIKELAELISALAQQDNHDQGDICKAKTQSVLLQLLDRIVLPDEFIDSLEKIRQEVEQHFDESDINEVLESLTRLITQSQSLSNSEKRDLEGFLQQITGTLAEIDQHIRGSQDHQQQALDESHQLDNAVQSQVREIQQSVQQANDLKEVKVTIQSHLENIRGHLKEFRSSTDNRHKLMAQAMSSLVNKVTQMESESAQLKDNLDQQREMALRDPLTGIHNRQAYDDHLALEYSRWKRSNSPLTIIVWDIDHFKRVNDEFGHQAGDKALKIVAKILQNRLRESDYIARYGGEEFVSLMPETKVADAINVANQIRESIAASDFHYNKVKVPITISCGLAQFKENDTPEDVFKRADDALYLAKEQGRNRCKSEGDLP